MAHPSMGRGRFRHRRPYGGADATVQTGAPNARCDPCERDAANHGIRRGLGGPRGSTRRKRCSRAATGDVCPAAWTDTPGSGTCRTAWRDPWDRDVIAAAQDPLEVDHAAGMEHRRGEAHPEGKPGALDSAMDLDLLATQVQPRVRHSEDVETHRAEEGAVEEARVPREEVPLAELVGPAYPREPSPHRERELSRIGDVLYHGSHQLEAMLSPANEEPRRQSSVAGLA